MKGKTLKVNVHPTNTCASNKTFIRLIIYQNTYPYRDDRYDGIYKENWLV